MGDVASLVVKLKFQLLLNRIKFSVQSESDFGRIRAIDWKYRSQQMQECECFQYNVSDSTLT